MQQLIELGTVESFTFHLKNEKRAMKWTRARRYDPELVLASSKSGKKLYLIVTQKGQKPRALEPAERPPLFKTWANREAESARVVEVAKPPKMETIGTIKQIVYKSDKWKKKESWGYPCDWYVHDFTSNVKLRWRPYPKTKTALLQALKKPGYFEISGGALKITRRGIEG